MKASNWRIWPIIAAVLAVLFIGWDVGLMSNARSVQSRIAQQVDLLDRLSSLNGSINQLGLTHRVEVNTGRGGWRDELKSISDHLDETCQRHHGEPGVDRLPTEIGPLLHACDSLHQTALHRDGTANEQRMADAVFQLMLQRAQKRIEHATRLVHEQGLGVQTASLSERWDEAQSLMLLACVLAVVFALLTGMTRKLLVESRERSEQLAAATKQLERTNRELRETMLSKEEKEMMIKEIHHRVKNNLQIVRSLIRFQLDQVDDARVRELFNECINRVGAMALVHEQTYLSKDLANIDVRSYLDCLVRDLVSAYNIRHRLTMDIDIKVKTLGVDTLIPLGLLINEVISNSFKHAFTGRETGTIIMHLEQGEDASLHLRIGDDGIGLRDRGHWEKPKSLGMELIQTLADQLNASVDLLPMNGTVYELHSVPLQARKRA